GHAKLSVLPCDLRIANAIVDQWHRHHEPCPGHKFSLKVEDEQGHVRGVAIMGRPVARLTDHHTVLEVSRLCTDGSRNACSALLGAAARVAKAMGFARIQTFTLEDESGASLRAVGWTFDGLTAGVDWCCPS